MFQQRLAWGSAAAGAAPALTPADVVRFVERLPSLQLHLPDAERIELVTTLEALKGAVAAAQARVSVAFADSQVQAQRSRGVAKETSVAGWVRSWHWRATSHPAVAPGTSVCASPGGWRATAHRVPPARGRAGRGGRAGEGA